MVACISAAVTGPWAAAMFQVGGGGDESPGGPPEHGPAQPEVLGEQVPGEQGEDADVDADGDSPRGVAEPGLARLPDGSERSDSAEYTQRADERGDDGDRDDRGDAPDLLAPVLGMLSCCFGHDTRVRKIDSRPHIRDAVN